MFVIIGCKDLKSKHRLLQTYKFCNMKGCNVFFEFVIVLLLLLANEMTFALRCLRGCSCLDFGIKTVKCPPRVGLTVFPTEVEKDTEFL